MFVASEKTTVADHPAILQTGREPELGQPKAISGRRAARKMGEDSYDLEGGGDGEMAFSDKSVRRGFIKKVYAIISVQVPSMRKICCSNNLLYLSSY